MSNMIITYAIVSKFFFTISRFFKEFCQVKIAKPKLNRFVTIRKIRLHYLVFVTINYKKRIFVEKMAKYIKKK